MRIFEDFLTIRVSYPRAEGEPVVVSMGDLAELLFCSQRNVKNLLAKMEQLKWISYTSGKGRGHMTAITFLLSKEAILQQVAENFVKDGNIAAAADFLKKYSEGDVLGTRFLNWLSHYFGVSVMENVEILKLPIYRAINTLTPSEAFYSLDSHLVSQVYDTLVKYNFETKEIEPSLSHFWEKNIDGTEWTFHLRKGVFFHDGKELTALDGRYSLELLRDEVKHWAAVGIKEIVVVSRYCFKIFLVAENHLFLHYLSYTPFSIVSSDATGIGTGPYKLISHTSDMCTLEAHDHSFSGRPFIDRIEILRVPELEGFEPKFHLLTVNTGESEKSSISEWGEEELLCGTSVLTMNAKKVGPLQDVLFRKALYHLIDREELRGDLGGPRLRPAHSFQLEKCGVKEDAGFDVKTGIDSLSKCQYKGEVLHLYTYERHSPDAFWLKDRYRRFGITVEITIFPWKELLDPLMVERADFILFEVVMSEGFVRLIEAYMSPRGFIRPHLDDNLSLQVKERVERALTKPSSEDIYHELNKIEEIIKERYALLFLNYKTVSALSHESLQGVKVNAKGWVDFSKIWIKP